MQGSSKNILVLDSGCSAHMTGNKSLLSKFEKKAGPAIIHGDDSIGNTLGDGCILIGNVVVEDVGLVERLNAQIEGEQPQDNLSGNLSGDTSMINPDDFSVNPDDSTGLGGVSEDSQRRSTNEAIDEGGASSSRQCTGQKFNSR